MYYSTRRGYINVILLIVIILVFFIFIGWISYNTGVNIGEGRADTASAPKSVLTGIDVPLTTISLAENADLQKLTGLAKLDSEAGLVEVDILFPDHLISALMLPEMPKQLTYIYPGFHK